MKTKKCIMCKTQHSQKLKGDIELIGDLCIKCSSISQMLESVVRAINLHISIGDTRPRRRLSIREFNIEKI